MVDIFIYLMSILIVLPVVAIGIIFWGMKGQMKRKKALNIAINVSTIFFILSVYAHGSVIFPVITFYHIVYVLIGIVFIVVYIHWKKHRDLIFSRLIRQYCRMTFFIFFLFYVGMVCYGLVQRVMEYIA